MGETGNVQREERERERQRASKAFAVIFNDELTLGKK